MFTQCYFIMAVQVGGERGGAQALIGMQLTGLMLNRCDSVLGKQSQSSIMLDEKYNQTESRSWIHPPEDFLFLCSLS